MAVFTLQLVNNNKASYIPANQWATCARLGIIFASCIRVQTFLLYAIWPPWLLPRTASPVIMPNGKDLVASAVVSGEEKDVSYEQAVSVGVQVFVACHSVQVVWD